MIPPQGAAALLEESLVVYKGATTSDGNAGGTTLVCLALAAKADWDGNQIIITSGSYKGQARDINGETDNVTGTVTVANAFDGKVLSGTSFVITGIRTVPAEVAECIAILNSDSRYILSTALTAPTVNSLTKFIASGGTGLGQPLPASTSLIDIIGNFTGPYNGAAQDDNVKASLDLVIGLVDSAEVAGPYSYTDAGGEQTVKEDTAVTRRHVYIELSNRNMAQTGTFCLYRKVDGTNYDLYASQALKVVAGSDRAWDVEFTTNQAWKVTYEEDANEGTARDIPYNIITRVIE